MQKSKYLAKLVGDLNCDFLSKTITSYTNQLEDMLELFQIKQLITGPTRITETTETLLGLCMTNTPEKINNTGIVHLGISDHSLIYGCRKIALTKSPPKWLKPEIIKITTYLHSSMI